MRVSTFTGTYCSIRVLAVSRLEISWIPSDPHNEQSQLDWDQLETVSNRLTNWVNMRPVGHIFF